MSVTVKRSTQSFSSMVNISVRLDEVTLDKLSPGESVIFELPEQKNHIKIKSFFKRKEIEVSDGDLVNIVRNSRIMFYKIASHLLTLVFLLLTVFRVIESPVVGFSLAVSALILHTYIYYFVPDFLLEKGNHPYKD